MAMVTTGDNNNNSFFLTSCSSSFDIMPVKNESLLNM
jgi:hypothetical protein